MSSFCEQEFMLKNFWFHHNRPSLFVTPQFGPHALYPAWLAIQLLYHIIALSLDGYQTGQHDGEPTGNYLIYLPNWTYLILIVSNIVDISVTLYVHCLAKHILDEREQTKTEAAVIMRNRAIKISYKTMGEYYIMRGYLKVSWVFFTLSTVTGVTVSFLYWTLHFLDYALDYGFNMNASLLGEKTLDYGTLAFNFINTLVILIHIVLTAKPLRLLHFYIPMIYFTVYFVFSIVYQRISGNYIYKILDWNQVFITIGLAYGVVFIVVPLVHLLLFGFVQLRIKVGTVCGIRYAYAKWKTKKVLPLEPEVNKNTTIMRWINSERSDIPPVIESKHKKQVSHREIMNVTEEEQTNDHKTPTTDDQTQTPVKTNLNLFNQRIRETPL